MDAYSLVRQIGVGSFANVQLVECKGDGKQYVLKQINLTALNQAEQYAARREIAILARLNHPSIVRYHGSFEEAGCLTIQLDFCAGGDLGQVLEREASRKRKSAAADYPTEELVWEWFVQVCLALAHMHARHMLHRDLKAHNVFLTGRGQIKLGDFGIARVLDNTFDMARTCVGTPYYLSPEICESRPYDSKTDVWALGCLLYEMIALRHPFEANNMKSLVLRIVRASFPPLPPRTSSTLKGLVGQMLKLRPPDRPSVEQILAKGFLTQHKQRVVQKFDDLREFYCPNDKSVGGCENLLKNGTQKKSGKKVMKRKKKALATAKERQPEETSSPAGEDDVIPPDSRSDTRHDETPDGSIDPGGNGPIGFSSDQQINVELPETTTVQSTSVDREKRDLDVIGESAADDPPTPRAHRCCCRKCGRDVVARRQQCRKCGIFDKLVAEQRGVDSGSSDATEAHADTADEVKPTAEDGITAARRAEAIRAQLNAQLGEQLCARLYKRLLSDGDWLPDGETADIFQSQPNVCRLFVELLVAECATPE